MRTIEEIRQDIKKSDDSVGIVRGFEYLNLFMELAQAQDAEIARLRQQHTWQPIETAPINTWILVLDTQPSRLSGPVSAYQYLRMDGKYVWITDGDVEINPSHWTSIPPLPQAKEEKEENHE